uniref:Tubulin/FtsZ GTPase domain-containing protein n=1 Tax=Chromera velia CCMP2878 TaxID=1169474 RepID=A0A0G4I778_9ALVE|eukprot:Cvel_11526.t1-p1 / transcript=Cvel_11526.t1 / gene=Cvel_11526 / organism=Chromera_velia_CCMP2878 / gene_product=Tubulin alpha-5 chain, putative / transcript_product=Tubulin alpha-5 chain, putative / location=Cvel_scaffold727:22596-26060(+) / protein_length=501 / sequence_SO=supercontig / SO=protein_coding / is_pseudo=false
MKEVICLHLGQAGVQVGRKAWELFCMEHNIEPDGKNPKDLTPGQESDPYNAFFSETSDGNHVPRAVFFDTDPSSVDEVFNSRYGQVYHPENLMNFKVDSANNYFRARNLAVAYGQLEALMDRLRVAAEVCDQLQGFFLFRSYGGGTGTAIGDMVLEQMIDEEDYGFTKLKKFEIGVYPNEEHANSVVESYNCALATANSRDTFDMSVMLDNKSIFRICRDKIKLKRPTYWDVNSLLGQIISLTTTSLRFRCELSAMMDDICHNLIPNPKLRYCTASLAPVRCAAMDLRENFGAPELVRELFDKSTAMCDIDDPNEHRYEATTIVVRGRMNQLRDAKLNRMEKVPYTAREVTDAMYKMRECPKTSMNIPQFAPFINNLGVKVGIVGDPPKKTNDCKFAELDTMAGLLSNQTSIRHVFAQQHQRFLKLWYHKAYVHKFIECGMDEGELAEANESILELIKWYDNEIDDLDEEEREKSANLARAYGRGTEGGDGGQTRLPGGPN